MNSNYRDKAKVQEFRHLFTTILIIRCLFCINVTENTSDMASQVSKLAVRFHNMVISRIYIQSFSHDFMAATTISLNMFSSALALTQFSRALKYQDTFYPG